MAGDYAAALRVTGPLLDEVGGWVQAGSDGETALGNGASPCMPWPRPAAARQQDAEFDWYLAQSLKPSLTVDLVRSVTASPGERLDAPPFRRRPGAPAT